jgi:hypothetical protein
MVLWQEELILGTDGIVSTRSQTASFHFGSVEHRGYDTAMFCTTTTTTTNTANATITTTNAIAPQPSPQPPPPPPPQQQPKPPIL